MHRQISAPERKRERRDTANHKLRCIIYLMSKKWNLKKKNTQHKEAGGLNPDSNQPPFSRLLFTAGHPATIERQMTNAELLQPRELRAKLRGVSEPEGSRFPSPAHPFPSLPRAFLRARSGWSAGRTCHKTPPNPRTPNRRAPRSSPS